MAEQYADARELLTFLTVLSSPRTEFGSRPAKPFTWALSA